MLPAGDNLNCVNAADGSCSYVRGYAANSILIHQSCLEAPHPGGIWPPTVRVKAIALGGIWKRRWPQYTFRSDPPG